MRDIWRSYGNERGRKKAGRRRRKRRVIRYVAASKMRDMLPQAMVAMIRESKARSNGAVSDEWKKGGGPMCTKVEGGCG